MSRGKNKSNKGIIIALLFVVIVAGIVAGVMLLNKPETTDTNADGTNKTIVEIPKEEVDIIDLNSKTRPYAIMINNTPVAVKVQEGLNKAYMVYELPTEGNTSRLMALYKDIKEDLTVGTIRSARHNFIDYALESDAIFVHYGWSVYAKEQETRGVINYLNGLFDSPFWRNNPEKLASEHTAYTSTDKIAKASEAKKYSMLTDKGAVLNYNVSDVDISEKENAQVADKVTIPFGTSFVTTFTYNNDTKMYERHANGTACIDHNTKEKVSTKNIIVQKVNYSMTDGGYYWDLKTVGTGKGYFITNGYAVPITWEKTARKEKTKYYYEDGTEVEVSDGRTYIELQTTKQTLTIEANEPVVTNTNTIAN